MPERNQIDRNKGASAHHVSFHVVIPPYFRWNCVGFFYIWDMIILLKFLFVNVHRHFQDKIKAKFKHIFWQNLFHFVSAWMKRNVKYNENMDLCQKTKTKIHHKHCIQIIWNSSIVLPIYDQIEFNWVWWQSLVDNKQYKSH